MPFFLILAATPYYARVLSFINGKTGPIIILIAHLIFPDNIFPS
jgi:hypothetical protein